MSSFALQTMPTPLDSRIQLDLWAHASAPPTRGITRRYDPAIRHTCDDPEEALQSGPPQKRNVTVDTAMMPARTRPRRPDPQNPKRSGRKECRMARVGG